jgi:hypothetical protein
MENIEIKKEYTEIVNQESLETAQEGDVPAEIVMDKSSEIEIELKRGYREFNINGRKGKIYFPSIGDDLEINHTYSRSYTIYLQIEGLMLEYELKDIYSKRGVWTEADEEKVTELQNEIDSKKEDIIEANKDEELNELEKMQKVIELRKEHNALIREINILQSRKQELFSCSIESRAREMAARQRMVCCVKDNDDKRIWDSILELEEEKDVEFYSKVFRKAILFWSGIPDDFLESSQENQSGDSKQT